jgi:hypothetical protein
MFVREPKEYTPLALTNIPPIHDNDCEGAFLKSLLPADRDATFVSNARVDEKQA